MTISQTPPMDDDAGPHPPMRRDRPGGPAVWIAWVVILAVCGLWITVTREAGETEQGEQMKDAVGLVLVQLQGKYIIGAAALIPANAGMLYDQSQTMLNAGTLAQRQRFIVVAAETGGPAEASRQLAALDDLIAAPPRGEPPPPDPDQEAAQRILHELYPPRLADMDDDAARAAAADIRISPASRAVLVQQLGWFGELAAAGRTAGEAGDAVSRKTLLASAMTLAGVLVGVGVAGFVACLVGFAGLVLVIVLAAYGKMKSRLGPSRGPYGVYAETFAAWLVLFLGAQWLAGRLVADEAVQMTIAVVIFPASLIALGWPVLRGVAWRDVRHDVGLTLGDRPALEPLLGLAGYLVTLPILAAGLALTLGLMALQGVFAPEGPTFAPAGGPAHPVITDMGGPDVWPKLLVMLLAAVCAPLVEETMFRGVLYRHMRGGTARLGVFKSIALSTAGNTFLFAAIHPQGFVAIPALMGLACGMTLIREWRGTLVPSMVIHGTSNAIVMSMLWAALSV